MNIAIINHYAGGKRFGMEFRPYYMTDRVDWDTVNWSKALTFWKKHVDFNNKKYKCLEPGGRRGGFSLWLVQKGNDAYQRFFNGFKKTSV